MPRVRVEFMVEPFAEGSPGPHVLAGVLSAALSAGATRVSIQVERLEGTTA
jgi:hypothetical protein